METYESVKSNPVQPEQKEKKKGGAWKGIVAVILAAGVVGSTTISAFNLVTLKSYIAEQKKEENPETTEDYVKIADNYFGCLQIRRYFKADRQRKRNP